LAAGWLIFRTGGLTVGQDLSDSQSCVGLPVPVTAAVPRLVFVLEDQDLLAAALVQDLGNHARSFNEGSAQLNVAVAAHEQHLTELDQRSGFGRDPIDVKRLVRLHAILPAAGTDYGVDNCSPVVWLVRRAV
jgi:hypothetical protein